MLIKLTYKLLKKSINSLFVLKKTFRFNVKII